MASTRDPLEGWQCAGQMTLDDLLDMPTKKGRRRKPATPRRSS